LIPTAAITRPLLMPWGDCPLALPPGGAARSKPRSDSRRMPARGPASTKAGARSVRSKSIGEPRRRSASVTPESRLPGAAKGCPLNAPVSAARVARAPRERNGALLEPKARPCGRAAQHTAVDAVRAPDHHLCRRPYAVRSEDVAILTPARFSSSIAPTPASLKTGFVASVIRTVSKAHFDCNAVYFTQ